MSYPLFFLLTFSLAFVLTSVATRLLLPILARHHMGQKILEIGPAWHKSKEGTPTMGGLGFILATPPATTAGPRRVARDRPQPPTPQGQ